MKPSPARGFAGKVPAMAHATLKLVAALALSGCGGNQPLPQLPINATAQHVKDSAGTTVEDCGEFDEPRDDNSCRLKRIEECVITALDACRPAHGTHTYFTGEGDPVRVDYFSVTENGACKLVTVTDRSKDPVGHKGVTEEECKHHEWQPDAMREGCELLSLSECAPRKH